jgi:hypothetical protein
MIRMVRPMVARMQARAGPPLKDTIESSLRPGQHVCHFGSEIGSTTELSEQFTVQLLKVAAPKPRSLLLVASGLVVSAVRQMH